MKTILILTGAIFISFSSLFSQVAGDYRSAATGNWNAVGTWQMYNGVAWVAAGATPTNANGTITIQNPHVVSVTAAVTVDQVVIDPGAILQNTAGIAITINNSALPAGSSEFIVNGTFIENGGTSTVWGAGATWNMGANGTYIKTSNSSSNNWQTFYEGGNASIPATSNWIIRNIGGTAPVLTTIGAFYGNLTIEKLAAGLWVTSAGSTFQGAGGFPTIKGNLDIGGAGAGTVNFFNNHTNAQPTLVQGNILVRAGNTLSNFGTGLEVQGNITATGNIVYDACDGRKLVFSGGNAQSITITGLLMIWDFTMNKTANSLTLNSPIQIDNLATFTSGVVNTTAANIINFYLYSTVAGANNLSYVNGPAAKHGPIGITFPIGKAGSYRPLILGDATTPSIFWTEAFQNGCSTGCLASGYVGPNGAWAVTLPGANGVAANEWFVSGAECGNAAGSCGSACAGVDPSLHVGNLATSTVSCAFCPGGDCGAAYDASSTGGLNCLVCAATCNNSVLSNRRVESPTINCTGKTSVQVRFNYIENGSGGNDNASMFYFDGAVWSFLVDMPKTSVGNCGGSQHCWTPYTVALPASANNNPNVKIGFLWINNIDAAGTDPSFAVDDINIFEFNPSVFSSEYFPANPIATFGPPLVPTLTALSNCEYWDLSRAGSTDARTVGLTWNAATCFNTAFASFEVARWDGAIWQDHDGVLSGPPSAASGIVTTPLTVGTFCPFAIAYVPLPLPIELESFSATCVDNTVEVHWRTQSEINNAYFAVEKSVDAMVWTEVGRLNGAGNSNIAQSYSWTDLDTKNEAYYRLKQVDFDGKYKIYDPAIVKCSSRDGMVSVYPNPSNGSFIIDIGDGVTLESVMIYSSLGQFVSSVAINTMKGKTNLPIDLTYLLPGTYYLKMLVNGQWITKPIVVIK